MRGHWLLPDRCRSGLRLGTCGPKTRWAAAEAWNQQAVGPSPVSTVPLPGCGAGAGTG
jgi:hypothetical protein